MSLSSEPKESKIRSCIREAKKLARPELKKENWSEHEYANNFEGMWHFNDTCQRILYDETTPEQFIKGFEIPHLPVVIKGGTDNWPARKKWMLDKLMKKYRNQSFKCGEDNEGYSVKIKMKYYVRYMLHTKDDSPLYIFDSNFGESRRRMKLLGDYEVPKYFQDDLFKHVGEAYRPPYRWFVMGPARSGTGIHIDPLGTSAWNALIQGHKRWSLFPPTVPKDLIRVASSSGGVQDDEAITWYKVVYPLTKLSSWPPLWRPIEILQAPGDIVFVPGGWWHVVLNLDVTTAVTQNFCSKTNFPEVWHKTARGRTKLSKRWLRKLKIANPELWRTALSIDVNKPSGFPSDSSNNTGSSSTNDSETENDETEEEEVAGEEEADEEEVEENSEEEEDDNAEEEEEEQEEEQEEEEVVAVEEHAIIDSTKTVNEEQDTSSSDTDSDTDSDSDSDHTGMNPGKFERRFWRRYKKNPIYQKTGNNAIVKRATNEVTDSLATNKATANRATTELNDNGTSSGATNEGASTSVNTNTSRSNNSSDDDDDKPSSTTSDQAREDDCVAFLSLLAKQVAIQWNMISQPDGVATEEAGTVEAEAIAVPDSSSGDIQQAAPSLQTDSSQNEAEVASTSRQPARKRRSTHNDDGSDESDDSYYSGIGVESDGGFDVDRRKRRKEKRARTSAFYRQALALSPNNALGNIGPNREIHGGRTGTGADPDACAIAEEDEADSTTKQQ